jgi:hypothetical protein
MEQFKLLAQKEQELSSCEGQEEGSVASPPIRVQRIWSRESGLLYLGKGWEEWEHQPAPACSRGMQLTLPSESLALLPICSGIKAILVSYPALGQHQLSG